MFNPTNLIVDIHTIKQNLDSIQNAIGKNVQIMPIVKGHAYGVGFETISHAIEDYKIAGVATVAEAISLRKYYNGEIFLLYQPSKEDIDAICEYGFQIGVSNLEFLQALNEKAKKPLTTHINVETGSGMVGIQLSELENFCIEVKKLKNIKIEGIYMHYSCTESELPDDIEFSNQQSLEFEQGIEIAESILGEIPYKHAGCSSSVFTQPQTKYNLVRIGMILYGYYPAEFIKKYVVVKPAMKLTSKIIQITELPKDYYVGYERSYKTKKKTKVATVGGGYADGIPKKLFEQGSVIVNGQIAPIIGRVCMDIVMIDITEIEDEVCYGDEVCIFDNEIITINDIAKMAGSNIAECLVHMGQALNVKAVGI
jgi:alanine racemase